MRTSGILCLAFVGVLIVESTVKIDLVSYRSSVNITVGQTILLPASYTIVGHDCEYRITWMIRNHVLLRYDGYNCSTDPRGFPTWSLGRIKTDPDYKDRVEFHPLNASIEIKNAQLSDAGIYSVSARTGKNETVKRIKVWVKEISTSPGNVEDKMSFLVFGVRSALCLLPVSTFILLLYC